MSNHFPTPPGLHVSNLDYTFVFSQEGSVQGTPGGQSAISINYGFDTGVDGSGNVTYDYSTFDQDTVESTLLTMANDMATSLASAVGVTETVMRSHISLHRTWTYEPGLQAALSFGSLTQTETVG